MTAPKFTNPEQSEKLLRKMSQNLGATELTVVKNPSYIFRPFDIYPLAPRINSPRSKLAAIVKDMDGTTTTTEELCVHSLEFMVGKICGLEKGKSWSGLDKQNDLPHIIGNSTTKHVEYLLKTYEEKIDIEHLRKAYFYAVLWTLQQGKDPGRNQDVLSNLSIFGLHPLLNRDFFKNFVSQKRFQSKEACKTVIAILEQYPGAPRLRDFHDKLRAAIDIYYWSYHQTLALISAGQSHVVSSGLGKPSAHLIEPMPGVGIFLATVKGWLGKELSLFGEELCALLKQRPKARISKHEMEQGLKRLEPLGRYFETNPLRIAVVTSSILYEAQIVLSEVFKVLSKQAETWNISPEKKDKILEGFSNYKKTYDAFITASDSSEIRLKPHPDLYSLALHRMGVSEAELEHVIGFEDSESGTRAIRAAGVGLCVALPFPFTKGHDLSAASYILEGGLPEALVKYSLFLDPALLKG